MARAIYFKDLASSLLSGRTAKISSWFNFPSYMAPRELSDRQASLRDLANQGAGRPRVKVDCPTFYYLKI